MFRVERRTSVQAGVHRRSKLAALALGALTAIGLFATTGPPATAAPETTAAPQAAPFGPVGWDTYRDTGALPNLRSGVNTKQFSSYDRKGGNDDGFVGTYSCLSYQPNGRCVIADAKGPGEIGSIWFTYSPNRVSQIGTIRIELDGKTVINAPLQDLVDGKLGAPFVWPLVGNNTDTAGGAVIKVPMPYRKSMKITTQNNPHFYHVTYRTFPSARGVTAFDPADKATDVISAMRRYGIADPKPAMKGARSTDVPVNLAPGASTRLGVTGPGQISQLRLRVPQALRSPNVIDDGRAIGRNGTTRFTAAVDPNNSGVRITRRYDPIIGNQRANVSVDGTRIGQWTSGAPVENRWDDQVLEVPAALSKGKSQLKVLTRFVSSDLDVNEFRYDIHSKVGRDWVRTDTLDVGPNNPNDEAAHNYRIVGQTFEGLKDFTYAQDEAQTERSDAVLSGLKLRINFDGRRTVDAPIGSFFGTGLGKYDTRTLMSSVDTTENGAFTSWWPMPYARNATVALVNDSGVPIKNGSLQVTAAPQKSAAQGLAPGGKLGYFSTQYRKADTVNGEDWNLLTAQGRGVSYGVTNAMRGLVVPNGSNNTKEYLEGDERVYTDGSADPEIHGTGSEDFYESGWYFNDPDVPRDGVPYSMPMAGAVGHEITEQDCAGECMSAYRLMLADAVSFDSDIRFDIEHGPTSNIPANYESLAYFYSARR